MAKRIVSLQPGFDMSHQVMVDIARASRLSNAFFFYLSGAKFTLYPFLTIFFRLLGLNASQTGIICGFRAFIPIIGIPMWSVCARRFNKRRFVIAFSAIMLIVVNISLTIVPPVDSDETLMFCHKYNGTYHGDLNKFRNVEDVKNKSEINSKEQTVRNKNVSLTTAEYLPQTTHILNITSHSKTTTMQLTSSKRSLTTRSWTDHVFGGIKTYKDESDDNEKDNEMGSKDNEEKTDEDDKKTTKSVQSSIVSKPTLKKKITVKVNKPKSFTDSVFGGKADYKDNNENGNEAVPSNNSNNQTIGERFIRGIPPTLHHIADEVTDKINVWKEKVYAIEYRTFIIVLSVLLAGEILSSAIDKVAHNSWFEYLDSVDDIEKYGKQYIWIAAGAVVFSLTVSVIVDNTECMLQYKIHHFMIHFYLFAALMSVVFLLSLYFPIHHDTKQRRVSSKCSTLCRVICGDIHAVTYLITAGVTGLVSAPMLNYIFWKVLDIGGTEIQMGLSVAVAYSSELIMLLVGKKIMRKIGFPVTITVGLAALSIRLLYYSFLWNPWAMVPIEILHGFSNTGIWMAITSNPDFNQSPRLGRSTLLTMQFLYYNIGYGCGSLLSGFLYDTFSIEVVYRGASIFVFIWAVIFTLIQKFYKKPQHVRYSRLLMDDNMSDSSDTYEDDWLEMALKEH